MNQDQVLHLLQRFQAEGVEYVLVGGQAVRLNGFVRATEDIDVLLPSSVENGRRVIRALDFLPSAAELEPEWFEVQLDAPDNIRVSDELLIDLLFAANGHDYESVQPHVRTLEVGGVQVRTLDIDGLLMTKTEYRPKDQIDRQALLQMKHLIDVARQTPLTEIGRQTPLKAVQGSSAVRKLGFNPQHRMALVVFTDSDTVYGYPNLSDDEVQGLLAVLQNHDSLGHYVSTVIKPNHDHERVQF